MTDVIGVSDSHKKQVFGSLLIEIENFYFKEKVIGSVADYDNCIKHWRVMTKIETGVRKVSTGRNYMCM